MVEGAWEVIVVGAGAAGLMAGIAAAERSGATLALGEPLTQLDRRADGWVLTTSQRVLHTTRMILTTGGQSYPGSGTTGDGFRFAAQFGHTIVPPRPALVPLTSPAPWV